LREVQEGGISSGGSSVRERRGAGPSGIGSGVPVDPPPNQARPPGAVVRRGAASTASLISTSEVRAKPQHQTSSPKKYRRSTGNTRLVVDELEEEAADPEIPEMGQSASNLSLLSASRKSTGSLDPVKLGGGGGGSAGNNRGGGPTPGEAKFVRTSALNQPLVFNPHSSAHKTFKAYSSNPTDTPATKKKVRRRSSADRAGRGGSEGGDMSGCHIYLQPQEIVHIQGSWATVERQLFNLGARVFISLMENQPNIKRTFRQYRNKRHSELRINEDLQKLIMLLLCGMKRVVKYLSDSRALTKYLKRLAKRHSPTEIDFARINPAEVASVFCAALREIAPAEKDQWTQEVEDSWTSLIGGLLAATRGLLKTRRDRSEPKMFDEDDVELSDEYADDDDRGSDDGTESSHSSHKTTTFDRHLVLVGCQTFQEFFDRHPEVLTHFDKFSAIEIDSVKVSEALRMHASRVLAIVEDIVDNTGNPDRIRTMMQDLGRNHHMQGITQEHLDMLGPIICHTIRPLVFRAGLWTIEVEKSWAHLFDMVATLMKRGYPEVERCLTGFFPTLTHTLILKDTWGHIIEQMHEMGLPTFIKLFRLSANLRYYYPKQTRPDSALDVQNNINEHFECLVSVIDDIVRSLPDISSHVEFLRRLGSMHCDVEIESRLLELMGPVFCNTVRPLLLVQGKWSYKVESAWLLMFRHIAGFMSCGYSHPVEPKPAAVTVDGGAQASCGVGTGTDTQTSDLNVRSLETSCSPSMSPPPPPPPLSRHS